MKINGTRCGNPSRSALFAKIAKAKLSNLKRLGIIKMIMTLSCFLKFRFQWRSWLLIKGSWVWSRLACYFHGDWAWIFFYGHWLLLPLIQEGLLSITSESMCTEYCLTLNVPIATKVVCFSCLLKCLRSHFGKQCRPRSDCSYRSSLFWVHTVCFYT